MRHQVQVSDAQMRQILQPDEMLPRGAAGVSAAANHLLPQAIKPGLPCPFTHSSPSLPSAELFVVPVGSTSLLPRLIPVSGETWPLGGLLGYPGLRSFALFPELMRRAESAMDTSTGHLTLKAGAALELGIDRADVIILQEDLAFYNYRFQRVMPGPPPLSIYSDSLSGGAKGLAIGINWKGPAAILTPTETQELLELLCGGVTLAALIAFFAGLAQAGAALEAAALAAAAMLIGAAVIGAAAALSTTRAVAFQGEWLPMPPVPPVLVLPV